MIHFGPIALIRDNRFCSDFHRFFKHELASNTFFASRFSGWNRGCHRQQLAIWRRLLAWPFCYLAVSIPHRNDIDQRAWILDPGVYRGQRDRSHPSRLLADGGRFLRGFYHIFNVLVGTCRAIATRENRTRAIGMRAKRGPRCPGPLRRPLVLPEQSLMPPISHFILIALAMMISLNCEGRSPFFR